MKADKSVMMLKKLMIICFWISGSILSIHPSLGAQNNDKTIIKGLITDRSLQPINNVSVILLRVKDSSLVKGSIADANGKFSFINIPFGKYYITASMLQYQAASTSTIVIDAEHADVNVPSLILQSETRQLETVIVSAKKPMFEQKIDRMVINVKNSVTNAGGTALDVLEKSPGVTVNRQNNNIAINGKKGVVVMINSKISYMPMESLVQFLGGISAGNIEKIELITTPPAKYDAEGNAGYINIVLINNPNTGINGSYFVTAGYGKRALGGAGTNINYRNGKLNIYGNYNFDYVTYEQPGEGTTQLTKGANIINNSSTGIRHGQRNVNNLRMGIDYQLDSATIIGALVSGYNNYWTMDAVSTETIRKNTVIDTSIENATKEINHWQNLMTNLNFQHTFKPGRILYFDANYIYYHDNNPISYTNIFLNNSKQYLFTNEIRSGKITPINIGVLSMDYTTPLGTKTTMELGVKTTFSKFTNDVSVDNYKGNTWIPENMLTANYLLKENIAAAYSSFTFNLNPKTTIKAGLRYEYTTSNLGSTQTANIVDRKYGELFPTFYISQKLNEDNSVNFSYSRRITRPTFNDLAPFTIFFDPKTFFTGNPALQPAIANSIQASYLVKKLIFSISYTNEKNTIEGFQTQRIDTITNMLYLTARNFNSEQFATASFSLPIVVTKHWNMQNNINIDWRQINTSYNNLPVRITVFDYNINTTQRFTLPKDFTFEVTGFYYSTGYWGTSKTDPIYQVDAGIQKKFKNNKDILRFTANDMFNSGTTFKYVEKLPISGTYISGSFNFGMLAYKLTFTHNFGNNTLKEKRNRLTHAEDELNRVRN